MGLLSTLYQKFGEDVVFVSLSTDPTDTLDDRQSFRAVFNVEWTIAKDTKDVNSNYDVGFIPTIVLIDWEGDIRYVHSQEWTDESVISEEIVAIPEFTSSIFVVLFTVLAAVVVISGRVTRLSRRS